MVTIEDIAKRVGVSKSTVSKALNGATDVSEVMRESILGTAVEMGYSRTSHRRDVKTFCVFVENMAYEQPGDFGYDIILGFRKMAEPMGFAVVVEDLDERTQKETSYDQYMLQHNYVGALCLGFTLTDTWLYQMRSSRTPAVLLDNYVKANPTTAYIGVDNQEGMNLAVSHLKKLGHRRIGYLSGALGSYINQARYSAFFQALRQCGLPSDAKLGGNAYLFSDCLQTQFPRILKQGVTAVVCSHDLLAHTLMIHCLEIGMRIPEDISIIGFDNLPLAAHTIPPLTTVQQIRPEIGRSAFYAMTSLMGGIPISTLLLHAKLITRKSTGPAPQRLPVELLR